MGEDMREDVHVKRQGRREAFSEVLQNLKSRPAPPPTPPSNGVDLGADAWRGPEGTVWHAASDNVDAATARILVQAGALVALDPCGCGGGCGLRWLDDAARVRLARVEPDVRPSKRFHGAITAWRDDQGRDLVVVQWPIRWGDDIG